MMPMLSPLLEILATILVAAGAALLYARRFQTVPGIIPRCYVGLLCVLMLTSAGFSLEFETPMTGPAAIARQSPGLAPGQPPVQNPTLAPGQATVQISSLTQAQALKQAHHITLVVLGLGLFCLALLVAGKPQALSLALLCILAAALKGLVRSVVLEPNFDIYKVGLASAILASDALILALASVKKQAALAGATSARNQGEGESKHD